MVERFNGTLQHILRKCCTDKREWDDVLPYLLFAYREAPHASTGFSPFELLHGQHMRGPLELMYEDWTARKKSPESVVSFVLGVRQRLLDIGELEHQTDTKSKQNSKVWYDRTAHLRSFKE